MYFFYTSGGYKYNNILENEQGVFVIGVKDNLIQKLHYNTLISSLLSKIITTEKENLFIKKYLFFKVKFRFIY